MALPALRDVCRALKSVIFLQRQMVFTRAVCIHNLHTSGTSEKRYSSSDVGPGKVSMESDTLEADIGDYADGLEQPLEENSGLDPDLLETLLLQQQQSDLPLAEMESPYKKPRRRCVLCKYNIDLNYKNVQLLSQFTSPYSGRIYGRHITGLCIPMQNRVTQLIKRSRNAGFMPFLLKDTLYLNDPKLFDPFKPGTQKRHH